MSDNVGLSTPRGSGTSGYVQRNLAHVKPRDYGAPYPKDLDSLRHKQRQPDRAILDHQRKRRIELEVFVLRDRLEEEDLAEDEIEHQCDQLREKLTEISDPDNSSGPRRPFREHEVHEMADAKLKESERLRKALKISSDYEEGSHLKRQEEKLLDALPQTHPR